MLRKEFTSLVNDTMRGYEDLWIVSMIERSEDKLYGIVFEGYKDNNLTRMFAYLKDQQVVLENIDGSQSIPCTSRMSYKTDAKTANDLLSSINNKVNASGFLLTVKNPSSLWKVTSTAPVTTNQNNYTWAAEIFNNLMGKMPQEKKITSPSTLRS